MTARPTGFGRWALAACVALAVAATGSTGCDRGGAGLSERLPDRLTVALDEPGLTFLYGDDDGKLVPATALRDIPTLRRGAVALYHPDQVPVDPASDAVYAADLSDATRDDEVSTRRMSRDALEHRVDLVHRSIELGRRVALTARERAKMTEGSNRRQKSKEARDKFRDLLDRIPEPPDDARSN